MSERQIEGKKIGKALLNAVPSEVHLGVGPSTYVSDFAYRDFESSEVYLLTKSGSSGWTVMRAYIVAATEAGKSREIARQIAGLPGVKMADACWGSATYSPSWKLGGCKNLTESGLS